MILPELLSASAFGEQELLDPDVFLLDMRLSAQRAEMPSLSRAQEFSFATLGSELSRIPKEKFVLVICQFGIKAIPAAIYLRAKGFARIGVLSGGLLAWKRAHPELYKKHSTNNAAE